MSSDELQIKFSFSYFKRCHSKNDPNIAPMIDQYFEFIVAPKISPISDYT